MKSRTEVSVSLLLIQAGLHFVWVPVILIFSLFHLNTHHHGDFFMLLTFFLLKRTRKVEMALSHAAFADKIQIKEMFMNKEEVWACFQVLWSFYCVCVCVDLHESAADREIWENIHTWKLTAGWNLYQKELWMKGSSFSSLDVSDFLWAHRKFLLLNRFNLGC